MANLQKFQSFCGYTNISSFFSKSEIQYLWQGISVCKVLVPINSDGVTVNNDSPKIMTLLSKFSGK